MTRTLLLVLGGLAMAGIAAGDSSAVKHPVYAARGSAGGQESAVAPLMALSEDDLVKLVPAMNGLTFCGCPNCSGGAQEGQMDWNGMGDPDHVHCRFCNMVFPNDKYPEDKTLQATNRRGETETWRYHQDTKGQQYWFSAKARYFAKLYMGRMTYSLAAAYAHTGKVEYARRAALLLARYADVYPRWNVMNDNLHPDARGPISDAKPPYPYWGGIWCRWFYDDVPIDLIRAYDLIYDSGEIEKLGADVRKRVEDEVFRASVEFIRTYKEYYSNMSPGIYDGLIIAGRVLGEPDYVHDAIDRMATLYKTGFFADGLWHEGSVSYNYQTIRWMGVCLEDVKGHSDPPGYTWEKDGTRLEDVDLERDIGIIARSKTAPLLMVLPDGHIAAVHDAWPGETDKTDYAYRPTLLGDYGHGRLCMGDGKAAVQAHLHFSGGYGHQHADALSLLLYGNGQELLPDIGYTHTAWRVWTTSSASHNTVAVDSRLQKSSGPGGALQLYSPQPGPVQAIEAIQPGAYPGVVTEFRRRLIQVRVSPDKSYVVDVFRVQGGQQHEYFLHGSAWFPQTAEVSLPLQPVPGTLLGPDAQFELPRSEAVEGKAPEGKQLAYAMFSNLRAADTDEAFSVTWRFSTGTETGLRSTLLGQPGSRVVLADTPQVRPAKESDEKLPDFLRPSLVVQRQGVPGLASTFVAIHEPFTGEPYIRSVEALPSGADGAIVLAITHEAGTDHIVSSAVPGGEDVAIGAPTGLRARARIAVVREIAGKVAFAYVYDGEQVSLGEFSLTSVPSVTGAVEAVKRDEREQRYSLLLTGSLPAGEVLQGSTILITHADGATRGYEIQSVTPQGERALVSLTEDPGFDYMGGKTRFLYYPQREIDGSSTYRIDSHAAVEG